MHTNLYQFDWKYHHAQTFLLFRLQMQYDMTALKIFKWWLTKEIDNYEDAQFKKVDENKLDITIDSPSLRRYLLINLEI